MGHAHGADDGLGLGAERGVLIRSGEAIQTLKDIKVVALDKTGTITRGKPALTDAVALEGFDKEAVLRAVAAVEAGSEHPLAQAIVTGAREWGLEVPEVTKFKSLTARGVQGELDGETVRVGSRRLLDEAAISLGDLEERLIALETEGKTAMLAAIATMHDLGIHVARSPETMSARQNTSPGRSG